MYTFACKFMHMYVFIVCLPVCLVTAWIGEKMTVASDESYRDPTSLQGKLQKHRAFKAELIANSGQVKSFEMI